jgi:oligopeptide/dipeptide ABC transporter ATP-binding protein
VLGLVGESGSGKSTLARGVLRLLEPTAGAIRLNGTDITHLSRRQMPPHRQELHIVFQDPHSSLNPRMTCGDIVAEPLRRHRLADRRTADGRVTDIFDAVGLHSELRRYPHELSGGQHQRVGLARALIVEPSVLVADEPVSAEYLSDRIAVMHAGKIVEVAPRAELFSSPQHPYTQAMLSAAVVPDPIVQRARRHVALAGEPPSPLAPPSGCRFRTRCPLAAQSAPRSVEEDPRLQEYEPGHLVACHLVAPGSPAPRLTSDEVEGMALD